jgi:DNA-binding NarL/FixJ family response regulator
VAAAPAPDVAERFPRLTSRELEVLALMAAGRSNSEIAAELFLGVSTVKSHVNAIFAKLPARDRAQAIAIALGSSSSRTI